MTHSYVYASGKLLRDSWTESGVFCALDFFYDYAGNPYAVFYQKGSSRQRFYYLTNLQGDVIGLLNTSSQLVAEYDYDPYGNLLTKTNYVASGLASEICDRNPLRYRGYYYDAETGWYYLQSRYYDPALGRFLNADSYASTGQGFLGYNMFAYCNNTPVCSADPMGSKMQIVDDYFTGLEGFVFKMLCRAVIMCCVSMLTDDKLSVKDNNIVITQKNTNPKHPTGTNLVREIIENDNTVEISTWLTGLISGSATEPTDEGSYYAPRNCRIRFDATQSSNLGGKMYPGFIIMAHELIHAYHMINGTFDENHRE